MSFAVVIVVSRGVMYILLLLLSFVCYLYCCVRPHCVYCAWERCHASSCGFCALLCVEVHCELAGWRRSVDLCINLTLVVRPTTT